MKESYHIVEKKETRELAEFPEGFPGLSPKIIQEFPILDSRGFRAPVFRVYQIIMPFPGTTKDENFFSDQIPPYSPFLKGGM